MNAARLKALGLGTHVQWTWSDMMHAVDVVDNAGQVFTGWTWADPRLWSALATGLEGTLLLPGGGFNWQRATSATATLAALAQQTGWPWFAVGATGFPDFVTKGFEPYHISGAKPQFQPLPALFAFAPPWNMRLLYEATDDVLLAPASCATAGMCSLIPRRFPTFPKSDAIPGISWGLAPRDSPNQELLGQFATWLYHPDRQQAMMTLGFAPVISDASVQANWTKQQAIPGPYPLFDPGRYFDIATHLPPGFWSGAWTAATQDLIVVDSMTTAAQEMPSIRAVTQPASASYFTVT